jgi:DNA invertase Pin-like site-specific DNA recombinase
MRSGHSDLEWALSSTHLKARSNPSPMFERSFVVYYRVSTPMQERSGLGLTGQRAAGERFVAKWRGKVIAEYTEIESGKNRDRAQLQKALGACRVYGATLLIAQLGRLARNVAFVSMLIETGAEFMAVDFPQANTFNKHILLAIAENELKLMSDRRKAVCAVLKTRGIALAQHLKGARVAHATDLDAARAAVLRRDVARAVALAPLIRDLRDRGMSINAIADELTRLEIEPPCGGARWAWKSVRRLFALAGDDPPPTRRTGRSLTGDARTETGLLA